jgi:hypothetical protein
MTQNTKDIEYVQIKREAEIWALGVRQVHAHSLNHMPYDTRPQDTANGKSVVDTEFNSGIIERTQDGKLIHTFGKKLTAAALIAAYTKQ